MLAFVSGAAAWAAAPEPPRGRPIVEIRCEAYNVFEGRLEQEHKLFALADKLHRTTRPGVIERELLFKVGDPYDPSLLRETERNLRALPFLRKVEILGVDTSSGAVITVRTWDAWTLTFSGNFSRAGGVSNASGGVAENNVLGWGKSAGMLYSKNGGDFQRSATYRDPQLFGRRHIVAQAKAQNSTGNRDYELTLGRPFFASIAPSSLVGGGTYVESAQTAFEGPFQAGTVGRRHYDAYLEYGYALEARPRRTQRLALRLRHERNAYFSMPDQPVPAPFVPDADQHSGLIASYSFLDFDWIKQKRIQKLSREEDFNTGLLVAPSLEYAPWLRALGATGERLSPALTVGKGFASEMGHLVFLRAQYSSVYVNGAAGNTLARFDAQYFCRYFPRHTVAAHAEFDRGWRLDYPTLLALGEDNGLRGYRAAQFTGDRKLLFNLEERMFWGEDIFRLLDAGGVVFFDSGYVWGPARRFALDDMRSSYGFGLRFAATRSADNVPLRIDVAHALNDNQFRTRWTVSIQAGAAFGPN